MAETVRRLITVRGRPVRSAGRLLAAPLWELPVLAQRASVAAQDRVRVAGSMAASVAGAVAATDAMSTDPPPTFLAEPAVAAGAAVAAGPNTLRTRIADATSATAGFDAYVTHTGTALRREDGGLMLREAGGVFLVETPQLSTANSGPLPRITYAGGALAEPATYDADGKAYLKLPASLGAWANAATMAYEPVGAEQVTNLAFLNNPSNLFRLSGDTLGVAGAPLGPAGTIYEVVLAWVTDTAGTANRSARIEMV